jgi:hypothetical protein
MTGLQPAEIIRHIAELAQQFRVAEFADHGITAAAEATAPMLPAIRDIVSARRNAVVGLWHSSAAPAIGEPLSSCRNGIAT